MINTRFCFHHQYDDLVKYFNVIKLQPDGLSVVAIVTIIAESDG